VTILQGYQSLAATERLEIGLFGRGSGVVFPLSQQRFLSYVVFDVPPSAPWYAHTHFPGGSASQGPSLWDVNMFLAMAAGGFNGMMITIGGNAAGPDSLFFTTTSGTVGCRP
jgi:hypothetical protein